MEIDESPFYHISLSKHQCRMCMKVIDYDENNRSGVKFRLGARVLADHIEEEHPEIAAYREFSGDMVYTMCSTDPIKKEA